MITLFNMKLNEAFETEDFNQAKTKVEVWAKQGTPRGEICTDGVNPTQLFKNVYVSKGNYNQVTELRVSPKKETRSYKEVLVIREHNEPTVAYFEMRTSVLRTFKDPKEAILNRIRNVLFDDAKELSFSADISNKLLDIRK